MMSLFGDYVFFCYLVVALIPAVALTLLNKSTKLYVFIISWFFIFMVMRDNKIQLLYFVLYLFYELHLVKIYLYLRKKYDRSQAIYYHVLIFSLLPLILSKLAGIWNQHWFIFIGISYITFRVVQIIIEIYDGVIKEVAAFEFLEFLVFFPTLSSGPIDRSRRFEEDLHKKRTREEYSNLCLEGFKKIFLGVVYKFVFASIVFQYVEMWSERYDWYLIIAYAYAYGFYMFFDFAGYSLMAIGVSNILGIETPNNFNKPFLSIDIKDFWNRWHITLSHWLRDFVFSRFLILSMKKKWFKNRLTTASTAFIINMLIMGIWHGLSFYYIIYGLYHGVLMAIVEIFQKKSKFYKKYKDYKCYKVTSWFLTINLVMFGFLIFSGRCESIIRTAIQIL